VYAGQSYDDIYGGEQDGGSGHTDRHDMDTDAEEAPDESAGMTGRKRGAAAKRRPSKKGGQVADESSKKAKVRLQSSLLSNQMESLLLMYAVLLPYPCRTANPPNASATGPRSAPMPFRSG
jgi:hypothetical protein